MSAHRTVHVFFAAVRRPGTGGWSIVETDDHHPCAFYRREDLAALLAEQHVQKSDLSIYPVAINLPPDDGG